MLVDNVTCYSGEVSWDEFHMYFLKQHGYDDEFIKNHKHNNKGMPREVKGKSFFCSLVK